MTIYVGADKIGEVYVGSEKMAEAWVWNGTAWEQLLSSATGPVPMGITLSADYDHPTAGIWHEMDGWTERAGYPDTALSANRLTMPAGTYSATTNLVHYYDYNQFGSRVVDETGFVLASIGPANYYDPHDLVDQAFYHEGGLLWVEVYSDTATLDSNIITAGSWAEFELFTGVPAIGVTKSNTQTLATNTWVPLTGYVSRLPGSRFDSDGLTVGGEGDATILAHFQRGYGNGNFQGRILLNGTVVSTSATSGTEDVEATWTGTLTTGDRITLEGYTDSTFNDSEVFEQGTYVEVTPV